MRANESAKIGLSSGGETPPATVLCASAATVSLNPLVLLLLPPHVCMRAVVDDDAFHTLVHYEPVGFQFYSLGVNKLV